MKITNRSLRYSSPRLCGELPHSLRQPHSTDFVSFSQESSTVHIIRHRPHPYHHPSLQPLFISDLKPSIFSINLPHHRKLVDTYQTAFRRLCDPFAIMFVRLSVCPSGTDVHCDHTVHVSGYSAGLSLWLDSSMFWAPWHQSMFPYSQPSFSISSTRKRGGLWMCKLVGVISQERFKLILNANRKSYMPRRLAQHRMTLSDLEWHRALSLR